MRKAPTRIIVVLGIATFLAIASMAILAVSFATNHWIEVDVDREMLTTLGLMSASDSENEAYYFNRDRGLFRTCYNPAEEAKFLDGWKDVVDTNCQLERGYELKNREETDDWGDDYETRIHLLRCHWVFFVVALLLIISACLMGLVGCWRIRVRLYLAAALCMLLAALFTMSGMIIFHVYYDLENDEIDTPEAGFPAYWENIPALSNAQRYFDSGYGYSYFLGWVSFAITIASFIMFAAVSSNLRSAKRREKVPLMEFVQAPAMSMVRQPVYPRSTHIPTAYAQPRSQIMPAMSERAMMPIMHEPQPMMQPQRQMSMGMQQQNMGMSMHGGMHMQPSMMGGGDGMVPVVPVGPPMVPVLPITEVYDYQNAMNMMNGGPADYDYPAIAY